MHYTKIVVCIKITLPLKPPPPFIIRIGRPCQYFVYFLNSFYVTNKLKWEQKFARPILTGKYDFLRFNKQTMQN